MTGTGYLTHILPKSQNIFFFCIAEIRKGAQHCSFNSAFQGETHVKIENEMCLYESNQKNNRNALKMGGKHPFSTESGNKGVEKRIITKEQHKYVGLKSVRVKN